MITAPASAAVRGLASGSHLAACSFAVWSNYVYFHYHQDAHSESLDFFCSRVQQLVMNCSGSMVSFATPNLQIHQQANKPSCCWNVDDFDCLLYQYARIHPHGRQQTWACSRSLKAPRERRSAPNSHHHNRHRIGQSLWLICWQLSKTGCATVAVSTWQDLFCQSDFHGAAKFLPRKVYLRCRLITLSLHRKRDVEIREAPSFGICQRDLLKTKTAFQIKSISTMKIF